MAPQGFRCTEVRKQRRPSTRRLSADQALTERGSQTKRQCPDADQVEAAVLLCPKRAPLRRQRMHSKRRFAVGAGLHTYSPRGVHVTGLLDGFATAAERHFLSPQPVARTHPAVIAGLWFSSAVVGGSRASPAPVRAPGERARMCLTVGPCNHAVLARGKRFPPSRCGNEPPRSPRACSSVEVGASI